MPCYNPFNENNLPNNREIKYTEKIIFDKKSEKLVIELKDKINNLEAGLCAIFNELERKGIANEIISQASKSGLINLMDFWLKHSKEDETKMCRALHHFSEHEQIILKKILNNNNKI